MMGDQNQENVMVTNVESEAREESSVPVKVPKRILHFSDGVVEEYSSDDEGDEVDAPQPQEEDVHHHGTMGPWMLHKMKKGGQKMLAAADYVGESLAEFLGITTPKYILEIEEHKRQQEILEMEAKQDQENDWRLTTNITEDNNTNVMTSPPSVSVTSTNELPEVHTKY